MYKLCTQRGEGVEVAWTEKVVCDGTRMQYTLKYYIGIIILYFISDRLACVPSGKPNNIFIFPRIRYYIVRYIIVVFDKT